MKELGVRVHTCNQAFGREGQECLGVQSHPQLQSESEVNLGYETCVIAPSLAEKANNTRELWLDCSPSSPAHQQEPGETSNSSSCFQGFGLLNKGSLIYAFKFAV